MQQNIKAILDEAVLRFNQPDFIPEDPLSIPHRFSKLQDVEIMGFWVSMLAWGQRKTIMNSGNKLIELMDGAPHDFIINHEEKDRERFSVFKHRTFQYIDSLYFLEFFQDFYKKNETLETAFSQFITKDDIHIEKALAGFHELFFSLEFAPKRTRKHVATPIRKSTCKRLNMFLRWMVRDNSTGVDLGLWKNIQSSQLLMPLDVHVDRVARQFGLIERKQTDWKTVLELTERLREFDVNDPVKYDFALFGLGIESKMKS